MIHGNLDLLPERAVTGDAADEIGHALLDQWDSRGPRMEGPEGVVRRAGLVLAPRHLHHVVKARLELEN